MDFSQCLDCPPSPFALVLLFGVGAVLVILALVARRYLKSRMGLALIAILVASAAFWNLLLVLFFVYPHNHHVIYLASHRASLPIAAVLSGGFDRQALQKAEFTFASVDELTLKVDELESWLASDRETP